MWPHSSTRSQIFITSNRVIPRNTRINNLRINTPICKNQPGNRTTCYNQIREIIRIRVLHVKSNPTISYRISIRILQNLISYIQTCSTWITNYNIVFHDSSSCPRDNRLKSHTSSQDIINMRIVNFSPIGVYCMNSISEINESTIPHNWPVHRIRNNPAPRTISSYSITITINTNIIICNIKTSPRYILTLIQNIISPINTQLPTSTPFCFIHLICKRQPINIIPHLGNTTIWKMGISNFVPS